MLSAITKYFKKHGWKEIIMLGLSFTIGIPVIAGLVYGGTALLLAQM